MEERMHNYDVYPTKRDRKKVKKMARYLAAKECSLSFVLCEVMKLKGLEKLEIEALICDTFENGSFDAHVHYKPIKEKKISM